MMSVCAYGRGPLVFNDIAETVHQGLLELGLDSIRVTCVDILTRCATELALDDRRVRSVALCC